MSLSTMANNILRYCPGLNPDLVKSTLQDSYRQLGIMEWNRLHLSHIIHTVGPYSTGKVTITVGGEVTGVGAIFTSAMVGRQLRCFYQDSFFEILTVTPPSTLTLKGWAGEVITIPLSYTIFSSVYVLPSTMKVVDDVVYQTELDKKSQSFFNRRDPERSTTGTPVWWAYALSSSLGYESIEVYPVPDQTYPLRIYGKTAITPLADGDSPLLPEDLVEAHALLSCYRIKHSMSPKEGWNERVKEQLPFYQDLLSLAKEEDYQLGSHRDKVKDFMGVGEDYPQSDSFWASHDVD